MGKWLIATWPTWNHPSIFFFLSSLPRDFQPEVYLCSIHGDTLAKFSSDGISLLLLTPCSSSGSLTHSCSFTLSHSCLHCPKSTLTVPPCSPARPLARLPSHIQHPILTVSLSPSLSLCPSSSLPVYVSLSLHETNLTVSFDLRSPVIPTTISRSPQVHIDLIIVTVPSIYGESGRIYKQAFRDKLSKL